MFIQIDKGIYEKLSEAEKGVIQFLNQNEEKIPYLINGVGKTGFAG